MEHNCGCEICRKKIAELEENIGIFDDAMKKAIETIKAKNSTIDNLREELRKQGPQTATLSGVELLSPFMGARS